MNLGNIIRDTATRLVTGKRLFGIGKDDENSQIIFGELVEHAKHYQKIKK